MPAPPLVTVTAEQQPYPVETLVLMPGTLGVPVSQTAVSRAALFSVHVRDWLEALIRGRQSVPRVSL